MCLCHGKAQAFTLQEQGCLPPSHGPLLSRLMIFNYSVVHTKAEFKEFVESDPN